MYEGFPKVSMQEEYIKIPAKTVLFPECEGIAGLELMRLDAFCFFFR